MKIFILLITFFITTTSIAQTDTAFYNSNWDKSSREDATYFRLVEKQGNMYLIKDMYIKTNKPQMVAFCSNAVDVLMKNGKCTYYSEKGMKESEGIYKQNKKTGIWVNWYDGGKDSSVTNYKENEEPEYIRISNKEEVSPDGELYTITESMPEYPGGYGEMGEFIKKNIRVPKKERKEGIRGTCYVTFYVDTDGSLKNVRVLKGIPNGEGMNEEAVRVVKMMPKWKPGTQNGKKVKVQFNLPIKFK